MSEERTSNEFTLDPYCELRFEVQYNHTGTLKLNNGFAEIFGTELVRSKKYEFAGGAKVALFTWQGCTVELSGKTDVPYIARDTPMGLYYNCHAAIEEMRAIAEKENRRGPITMIVGPSEVGKSTVCRILLNYAVRMKRKPIFVDLDVNQGYIAIPGTLGALLVERTSNVTDGFDQQTPLVFHFGHKTPNENVSLYNLLVSRLAEVCSDRLQANKKSKVSGVIINTCGWVQDDGYKSLIHAAQAFEVDAVLVLDQEKLYNELVRDMPSFVKVVFLPKSTGIVKRSHAQRTQAVDQRIREYFYGSKAVLYPYSFEIKWSDARIYKIGASILPASCMPLGMEAENNSTKLVAVDPGPNLFHHLLSVSYADLPDDDIIQTNAIGFVCVTNVDVNRKTITVLSPQPPPLPNTVLLLSDIQFMDNH